ncbi:class I SAM-dependent methyltransferase [Novipirellula artificiosorum]|uniref:Methyltransferase domain protein n=1 Tax=Novipirellula artificiosorum TaxID=2528016 RepID=A0A5C6DVB6_9BACT|nr:class I SAM-dependent methyltransferase [Novipirellula artificiosorum]TWU40640.1 Methyltransferase domain protein [Novipirellula artificiosorum]
MNKFDILKHNRQAWDRNVDLGNKWTSPVDKETIEKARLGDFTVVLTPAKPVPAEWFPPLQGTETLCLASAGGQQSPLFTAAGAKVTVFDHSPRQLDQDRFVAQRDGLTLKYVEGDMADLSVFADRSFDFIFHPCSNTFAPNVLPVWRECYRVLRSGGDPLSSYRDTFIATRAVKPPVNEGGGF